jgi:predicted dinucleotide-binding enzyme
MTKLLSQITSFVVVFSIAAGDDKDALAVASTLVRDAGFNPVMIGPLERAKDFAQGALCTDKKSRPRTCKSASRAVSPPAFVVFRAVAQRRTGW